MKTLKILFIISFVFLFAECSDDTKKVEPVEDEFSFTYNSQNYNYSITGNVANAGVSKEADGTASLMIDMVNVFGGQIYFKKTDCAYLVPEFTTLNFNTEGCIPPSENNSNGNVVPIDEKVFVYQSGSLNVSFSNCVTKSKVDFVTGINFQQTDCAAIGTFDLTLINKNNSTIKITNGIVKFHHVIVN